MFDIQQGLEVTPQMFHVRAHTTMAEGAGQLSAGELYCTRRYIYVILLEA